MAQVKAARASHSKKKDGMSKAQSDKVTLVRQETGANK